VKMRKVAIIGLGLIGGSLGLALRNAGAENVWVTGYARRPETTQLAMTLGALDHIADTDATAVSDADFVFLCSPVLSMLPLAERIIPHMKQGAVLTDVGSTKAWLGEEVRKRMKPGAFFIGAHPMAGKEKNGIQAADKDLFDKRWFLLTPDASTPLTVVEALSDLIKLTGAKIAVMNEKIHDRRTAVISHVPHVVASALVHLLDKDANPQETARFVGGGFRDTTRIASSDADMWADICMTNQENITNCIADVETILSEVRGLIAQGDRESIRKYFLTAKVRRDMLLSQLTVAPD
jgi:prephenate dehydrogenase